MKKLIEENGKIKVIEAKSEKQKLLTKKILKKRASSSTLDGLREVIKKNLYWSDVIFKEIDTNLWSVSNLNGLRKHYIVIKEKRGFFLYEIMEDDVIDKIHNN